MKKMSAIILKFYLELLRIGLKVDSVLDKDFNAPVLKDLDWNEVYHLAQEQTVQGVVLSGLEELRAKGIELSAPKVLLLQWIGEVQMIEQRNKEMIAFISELIE